MNRICIAVLMTVMICASGCGPSMTPEEATKGLLSASQHDEQVGEPSSGRLFQAE